MITRPVGAAPNPANHSPLTMNSSTSPTAYTLPNGQVVTGFARAVAVALPNGKTVLRWTTHSCTHAVCFDDDVLSLCESEQQAQKRINKIACPEIRATLQIVVVDS